MTEDLDRLTAAIAGRYTLDHEVGRGGMATVYLADDLRHRRRVAVKVLHPDLARAVGPERFLREIEIAAGLSHPHILPLHDSGDAGGTLYYVMPFVAGESLQDRLSRERQLPIDDALRIAREVADALHYAHGRGIVHRDVKPANIMLESNHALVTDFGVALIAQPLSADRLTVTGVSPGTPAYMSPEQATGGPVDGRADIYALGCVLYEMLCGEPPFTGSSARAVLTKKLFEPVPSIRRMRETVSPELERAIETALARTPADRFRTAAEFAQALDAAAASGPPGLAPRPDHAAPIQAGPAAPAARLEQGVASEQPAADETVRLPASRPLVVAMGIPAEFTPSRWDFPVLGVRALIPSAVWAFIALVVFVALARLARLLAAGARRVPPVRHTFDGWTHRSASAWRGLWTAASPVTIAELQFLGAVGVSVVVMFLFARTLPGAPANAGGPGADILSCAFRQTHQAYTLVMTVLVITLALAWRGTFRFLKRREAGSGRVALARWAGLAWILGLVLLATAPWRLLWNNERPRALLNGERAYILLERGADVVIYNAERRATNLHRGNGPGALERRDTDGYVFEDAAAFARPHSGC
jgi:tRNA A-37 threonylcarbamoyl transferase component Bud32